jgi:hypothetical protein
MIPLIRCPQFGVNPKGDVSTVGGWAAPRFPDSGIGAISCCELLFQVPVMGFLRSPVPEC